MSLATALTGILLCVLGFTHAGRAIRFVPYPVIGGFLGATGWLMVTGAIQVVTDQQADARQYSARFSIAAAAAQDRAPRSRSQQSYISAAAALEKPVHPARRAAGGVCRRRYVVMIIERLVARRGADAAAGCSSRSRRRGLSLPWKPQALHDFPWSALPSLAGDVLAVMFVTISDASCSTPPASKSATRTEAHIERDLKVLGFANLADRRRWAAM